MAVLCLNFLSFGQNLVLLLKSSLNQDWANLFFKNGNSPGKSSGYPGDSGKNFWGWGVVIILFSHHNIQCIFPGYPQVPQF